MYAFFTSPILATCPVHGSPLNFSVRTALRDLRGSWSASLRKLINYPLLILSSDLVVLFPDTSEVRRLIFGLFERAFSASRVRWRQVYGRMNCKGWRRVRYLPLLRCYFVFLGGTGKTVRISYNNWCAGHNLLSLLKGSTFFGPAKHLAKNCFVICCLVFRNLLVMEVFEHNNRNSQNRLFS